MNPRVLTAALAALSLAVAVPARAQDVVKGRLQGFQEVPANSTTGTGAATATLGADTIDFELTYSGLEGTVQAAHVHFGQMDVSGGIAAFLCGGGGKPACPQSGTVTGTIAVADVIGPGGQGIDPGEMAELMTAMRAGMTYVNIHTTKWPGGEVRAQLRRMLVGANP